MIPIGAFALGIKLIHMVQFLGLVAGFIQHDIHLTMWITLAGTLVTLLVVVPPWPFYNRHPQSWIGSRTKLPHGGIVVQGMKVS